MSVLELDGRYANTSAVASSYTLACWVSSTAYMFIGHPLGRRRTILLGDAFVIVGGSLQASSWSVPQIIIARVLCGFGVGLISCAVITYMSEMSIKNTERGIEAANQSIWLIGGACLGIYLTKFSSSEQHIVLTRPLSAYWIDFGFTQLDNQFSWRFPIALQSLFAAVSFCMMIMLPDTPRWYYSRKQNAEADSVLERLHNLPLDSEPVQKQKQEILDTIAMESSHARINLLDLLWDRSKLKTGRRLRVAFLILAIQQNMGINVLVYFATTILKNVGLSPFYQQLLAAVQGTAFVRLLSITPL